MGEELVVARSTVEVQFDEFFSCVLSQKNPAPWGMSWVPLRLGGSCSGTAVSARCGLPLVDGYCLAGKGWFLPQWMRPSPCGRLLPQWMVPALRPELWYGSRICGPLVMKNIKKEIRLPLGS